MRFLVAAHTDVGIAKKVNQDAFSLKVAKTSDTHIAFAALCDGMGGLKNGELASSWVVNAFSAWFEEELPRKLKKNISFDDIQSRWAEITNEQNQKIARYGKAHDISLGTTLTALLIIGNKYALFHVGDTRIYRINSAISQLTKDQTVVAMEVENKLLSKEQAKKDTRKNVLLQCVGASKTITPERKTGTLDENDVFLLCSDGFRHEVCDDELFGILAPRLLTGEKIMKRCLVDLVDLNKTRKERDNITALLIKAVK
jgi:serine/threonine protein phosphatase PrpC